MRVPYLKQGIKVKKERLEYIKNTCGGSTGLYSGALFWLMASIISLFCSKYISTSFYIFGGAILVPVLSTSLLKFKKKKKAAGEYLHLTIISNMIFVALYPIAYVMQNKLPEYIPMVVALINAAHLLVFMWIHLEFLYCILVGVYFSLSIVFIFIFQQYMFNYMGFALCIVNLVFAVIIDKSSQKVSQIYQEE
ncbi:DUF7010 family protein [Pseudobacteroides cellulosolvens]|uniref:Uncharacterized protein n=1 Tax=Pseudobacteroides cellulosolvens ATCC 35603 = DSM 2933 TaxID=398512 RepID=A0A0L6JK71_9FIRM|nr:hypothetical protein [Pseudobacteroides cellulosolvens]KNY26160.1 hypothetical protein Bccel_1422 [Pseudobacteroides cellulosolvens ATCC 35603 = DSM 2933]